MTPSRFSSAAPKEVSCRWRRLTNRCTAWFPARPTMAEERVHRTRRRRGNARAAMVVVLPRRLLLCCRMLLLKRRWEMRRTAAERRERRGGRRRRRVRSRRRGRSRRRLVKSVLRKQKDVIGAAETGSGKTLAFGLPILQRLLEEREKAEKKAENVTETVEEGVKGSPIRALVVTPTREFALQICSHLREMAVFSNIHVVPIVGGIYAENQERLLRKRPEIVVGTPGRLWELMSGG